MKDAGLGVLGQFNEIVRQVAIEEDCHSLVVLGKLVEQTYAVDDCIKVAFGHDLLHLLAGASGLLRFGSHNYPL